MAVVDLSRDNYKVIANNAGLQSNENVVPVVKEEGVPVAEPVKSVQINSAISKIKSSTDGLNQNLVAVISADGVGTVKALVVDATLSQESTWSTPFENSNPENRLPSLLGSLQSEVASDTAKTISDQLGWGGDVAKALKEAGGRSSFTKVNSTQIYVSSQSAQIQLTLLLSAWSDAGLEVEAPLGLLHRMAMPMELSDKTQVQNLVTSESIGIETFLPSIIPPKITLQYGGRTYKDLVMHSFQRPLSGLMDSNGNLLQAEVSITLVGYQAWDGKDVASMYAGK